MDTTFIPIDYDSFDFEGRNYIKIIGRNEKGNRLAIIDTCPIYIWAILKETSKPTSSKLGQSKEKTPEKRIKELIAKIEKIKLDVKGRQTKVEKVELHNKNFLGKPVKALKIFATNYKDLHDIADKLNFPEIEKRRGYDLGFITNYIIEKKINPLCWYEISGEELDNSEDFGSMGKFLNVDKCILLKKYKPLEKKEFNPKILAYDIETDDIKIGKGEILMVSLVSNNFKKIITWKGNPKKSAISSEAIRNCPSEIKGNSKETRECLSYVEYAKDEAELLDKFVKTVKEISPDFLVGYFSDNFDLPYIKARAEINNVKLNLGLDDSQPRFTRGINLSGRIDGIVHIDLIKFIKTAYAQYMQSETLTLNEISKEFLGETKTDFKLKHSSKIKEDEWKKYYEYCIQDSDLTRRLFEKFWPDIFEFTRTVQEPVFEVSRAGLSRYVESYILHNLERFNEIPEKKPMYDEIGKRREIGPVEGAFVYEPSPGLYENIAMFDFTSMHTSIIISMNISKGTILEKKEKDCYESPEIETDEGKKRYYFSKKPGFFPEILKDIFEKRKKFKEEYKKNPSQITKARSNAFKVLSASVHGYIGFFGARYYSKESSAAILAFVRKFNKDAIEAIKSKGYQIIYGDTDSIAFLMKNKSENEIKELLKGLNSNLPGNMELELDGFFKRGLWVTTRAGKTGAKKKYALIDKEGKLKIRGFEMVRRDWCKLARELQNNVIKNILEQGNEKKALEYTKEIAKKIKKREINKEDII
ncbi:MAG: DNA-directed DNA polymerase, partial [Candidatus Gastranaerophilales bacterium]|nr:DNA-directed DNA polymerase [Candidatus Gastranaerophilales bacterium]